MSNALLDLPGVNLSAIPTDLLGMRQLPLDLGQSQAHSLDDFAPGNNQSLLAWLRVWPQSALPGTPAYLWGPSGCGKTHLLHGLAARAMGQGWHVMWLGRRGFQTWDADVSGPDAPSLILLDDCQDLDEQQQHWAFNLFIENAAAHAAAQAAQPGHPAQTMAIVAAGRLPPVDLPVREDLRTRLGWGLTFAIEPLDEHSAGAALMQECQRRGVRVAEGVVPYLLTHFSRDLGFLMSLVDRLDRYALAEQRALTVPLLKQMLAQERA